MPAWSKVLSDQQIANVAEFVFQAFVQPEQFPEISGVEPVTSPAGEPAETKKKAL
jgi:mono/diheme cytochrome c family protein